MIKLKISIIDQQLHKFILTMPACKPHLKVSLPEDGRFEISTHALIMRDVEENIMGGYRGRLRDAEESGVLPVFRSCER